MDTDALRWYLLEQYMESLQVTQKVCSPNEGTLAHSTCLAMRESD